MIPKRIVFSALGLPLLVLACSPVTRTFPSGSGGATSSSADSSSVSAGGSGGSGGSGGAAPTGSCTKVDAPFDILTSDELGAAASLDDVIYLVADPQSLPMVHVILSDLGQGQTIVRTVVNDVQPLGNIARYDNGPAGPVFRTYAAWGGPGHLHIEGRLGNEIEELNYDISPTKGVGSDGKLEPYATPIECLQSGSLSQLVFAQDGEKARYVAVCEPITAGLTGLLFAGGWTGKPVQIPWDSALGSTSYPSLYTYSGGKHLLFFTSNKGFSFFGQGTTVETLAMVQPFKLTTTADERQIVLTATPRTGDDGVTLISAHVDVKLSKGEYWTGSTLAKDYATLSQVPPPGFVAASKLSSLNDAVTPSPPVGNAETLFSAGSTPDHKGVRLFWLTRSGEPLVFAQDIYTSADTTLHGAAAAPWGDSSTLVVWVEQIGTSSPYKTLVRGQRMTCKLD